MSIEHPKPAKEQPAAQKKDGEGKEKQTQELYTADPPRRIEVQFPDSQVNEYKAQQEKADRRECIKIGLEIATVAGVFIYAGLTLWQGCTLKDTLYQTRIQASAAASSFRLSERAWVGFTSDSTVLMPSTIPGGTRLKDVEIHYMNAGKSPATHVKVLLRLRVGDPIPTNQGELKVHGPILPECADDSKPLQIHEPGFLLLPNVPRQGVTYPEDDIINEEGDIMRNAKGLYLIGCIDYCDEFGVRHRTRLCRYFSRQTPGRTFNCTNGNGIEAYPQRCPE